MGVGVEKQEIVQAINDRFNDLLAQFPENDLISDKLYDLKIFIACLILKDLEKQNPNV